MASAREIKIAYHLADLRNWASIQARGLLSTQRLLELSDGADRALLRQHRPLGLTFANGAHIRDQSPMPIKSIQKALRSGVTPEDWFELLNSKIFFWLDPERLDRHRAACKNHAQIVLKIDATRLLAEYAPIASVSPINSGNAMRAAAPRNYSTFVPYEQWIESGWDKEDVPGTPRRPRNHRPVELAITGAIPNITHFIMSTDLASGLSAYDYAMSKMTGEAL